ncbi:MAG: ABC transporter substrate-binding protein [Bdellovibrio sp.]|nr:ABC transporter substrate-binding protein [Bdellovibrio sp.]
MLKHVLWFLTLIIVVSCGGITVLERKDVAGLYEKTFVAQIDKIKEIYRQGKVKEALDKLHAIDEGELKDPEKALRRNLIGVVYFSQENFEQAIYNFNMGLTTSGQDYFLTGQIKLNLASSYFKLGLHDKANDILKDIPDDALSLSEAQKAYKLATRIADVTGNFYLGAMAAAKMFPVSSTLSEVKGDPSFDLLFGYFNKLTGNEKKLVIEEILKRHVLLASYMAYLEAERSFFIGDKAEVGRLLDFAKNQSGNFFEIQELVKNFEARSENYSKVNPSLIAVVLPLSGKNAEFGQRALMGIDSALKEVNAAYRKSGNGKQPEKTGEDIKIIIRDSQGLGSVGSRQVADVIENNNVVAVIGGLVPKEAEKEYFEAKKHGTVFLSLSSLYIPRDQKDYLLLEIPGSIEGQMAALFSDNFLNSVGKRAGIVYPQSDMGQAYLDEFWRKAEVHGVEVTGASSYQVNETDFRPIVQLMLGLKYPNMREEEYHLLSQIHVLEKTSMRRVQTLPPEIDFDWVFIPAFPKEALQIIPTFAYFDAYKLKFIGGPSWRSELIAKNSSKTQKLFFIGDTVSEVNEDFSKIFFKEHQTYPKLIELRCYDALKILAGILVNQSFATRDEFDSYWRARGKLVGMTGSWGLNEGLWLKTMASLGFEHGEILELSSRKKN